MNKTIPVLPCGDADALIAFYQGLGFRLAGQFVRSYLVLEYDGIELHFYGTKRVPPDENSSMCIIRTEDADALHRVFETGLRAAFGAVPRSGTPRLTKVRDLSEDRRFTLTDPSGNTLYILTPKQAGDGTFFRDLTHGRHAGQYAVLYDLVYSKEDYRAAGKLLPRMLEIKEELGELDRAKLLLTAADIAAELGSQPDLTELEELIAASRRDGNWDRIEKRLRERYLGTGDSEELGTMP